MEFSEVRLSLSDLVGQDYLEHVCAAHSALTQQDFTRFSVADDEPLSFFPAEFQARLRALLPRVGERLLVPTSFVSACGAGTQQFRVAAHSRMAPLSGLGYFRLGEDGRLYLMTKSEHYHAPLGHSFPGYGLLDRARRLGIPNATHNNTRGHITRLLEMALLETANTNTSANCSPRLDCVLNLETGSLVTEAALKMMLARFYRIQHDAVEPRYAGLRPVLLVMGNDDGGCSGNYHGTTLFTQIMRGMWPAITDGLDAQGLLQLHPIRPNNFADLEDAFQLFEKAPYKIAGFFHELIMMNYGGRKLAPAFLQRAYVLCAAHDVPTCVDEIQSCLWAPELFLFREYGLSPTFVAIGKGFPGGEYAASRLLFSSSMDLLPLFGALVTNGQEELASLAYLVTMRWAQANAAITCAIGEYYEERLRIFAARHSSHIVEITGERHLAGIAFHEIHTAKRFTDQLNQQGFDISAQTYKADCPPVALTKLPLIAGPQVVDFIVDKMEATMRQCEGMLRSH